MKLLNRKADVAANNQAVLDYFGIEYSCNAGSLDVTTVQCIRQAIIRTIYTKYPKASVDDVEQFVYHILKDVMVVNRSIVAELGKNTINNDLKKLIKHCNVIKKELRRVCKEQSVPATGIDAAISKFTLTQMERVLFADAGDWRIPRRDYGLLYVQFLPVEKWLQFSTDCEAEEDFDAIQDLLKTIPLQPEEADFVEAKLIQMKLRGIG